MDDTTDGLAETLMEKLCEEHGVPHSMIKAMLDVERKHQFQDRRHGIIGELEAVIRSTLDG